MTTPDATPDVDTIRRRLYGAYHLDGGVTGNLTQMEYVEKYSSPLHHQFQSVPSFLAAYDPIPPEFLAQYRVALALARKESLP